MLSATTFSTGRGPAANALISLSPRIADLSANAISVGRGSG
jgi:hypothetical protein